MQADTVEQRIRDRAYALWQEDGGMEGCADEYWRRARELVEAEVAQEEHRGGGASGSVDDGTAGPAAGGLPR